MKEKLNTTSFWLGLSGAVVIVIESISNIFNISIATKEIESIILTICSVLVMLGIITKKNVNDNKTSSKEDLLLELRNIDDDIDDNLNNDL